MQNLNDDTPINKLPENKPLPKEPAIRLHHFIETEIKNLKAFHAWWLKQGAADLDTYPVENRYVDWLNEYVNWVDTGDINTEL